MKYLIIIAFLVRLVLPIGAFLIAPFYENFYIHYDSEQYIEIAGELVKKGRFYFGNQPELYRTPGYPIFLMPGIISGTVEWVTIVLQVFLSSATIYLVYKISFHLFKNDAIAFTSAVLYAVEPVSILYCSRIMSETLFAFLTFLFIYLLFKYLESSSKIHLLFAAVALAAAIYTRPILYYFFFLLAIVFLAWIIFDWKNYKKHIASICLFCIVAFVAIIAWQVRNGLAADCWKFSTVSDITLYFYKGASVLAEKNNISFYEMQEKMIRDYQSLPQLNKWTISEKYSYMRREGLRIIKENPFLYIKTYIKGLVRLMIDPATKDYMNLFHYQGKYADMFGASMNIHYFSKVIRLARFSLPLFACFILLMLILLIHIIFSGITFLLKKFQFNIGFAILLLLLVYFLLFSGGELGIARYRHPIMPFLSIFAGYSVHRFIEIFAKKKSYHEQDEI